MSPFFLPFTSSFKFYSLFPFFRISSLFFFCFLPLFSHSFPAYSFCFISYSFLLLSLTTLLSLPLPLPSFSSSFILTPLPFCPKRDKRVLSALPQFFLYLLCLCFFLPFASSCHPLYCLFLSSHLPSFSFMFFVFFLIRVHCFIACYFPCSFYL